VLNTDNAEQRDAWINGYSSGRLWLNKLGSPHTKKKFTEYFYIYCNAVKKTPDELIALKISGLQNVGTEKEWQAEDLTFRYAVEFRNITWLLPETKTFELLEKYHVAYTIVDEPLLPPEVHLTTDFTYFRWHGHGENIWFDYEYSKEELELLVSKVQQAADKVKNVYVYFNNHYHGHAPENCFNSSND